MPDAKGPDSGRVAILQAVHEQCVGSVTTPWTQEQWHGAFVSLVSDARARARAQAAPTLSSRHSTWLRRWRRQHGGRNGSAPAFTALFSDGFVRSSTLM